MAIETQIWVTEIAKNLYANNRFIERSRQDDAYVNHKTVNLPQSGSKPNVVKNRSTIPATPSKRVDSITSYDIDEYTTDPTVIQDIEEVETSYQKRVDVLMDHRMQLDAWIAKNMLYNWSPTLAASIARTTGTLAATTAKGASGNRKRTTRLDFLSLKDILDGQDAPQEGRAVAIDSTSLNYLLRDDKITSKDYMNQYNQETGSVGKLFGFDLYIRSSVGSYTTGLVPKDPFAVAAADDNGFILAWHPLFVRRALGAIKVYANIDDAENYGSVFSALVRNGGSKSYESQIGIAALVEDVA